ncbi:hypothetical protein Tco_1173917 [Tanacetum coccineum]
MNQNYDPNFCYDPIYSGFDQYQPPQFPEIHYPPQATDTEMLQARENLMETIQAFLKEYDHIPPEEKCMALLLAEERFLKIKQAVEEEQNQPEVMQELLLKLMNDLQILKGIQPKQAEQEEQAAKSFTPYGNFSMIDDVKVLQDRENLMKDIQTFLRKFSRIPFGEIPKVLLIAWERFSEIKHAFTDKQYQQEDIQELMSKLLEDVRNINEELSEFINSPSWNRPTFYNDDDEYTVIYRKPKAITPDLPIEEPDNSLSMGDEHLNTIPETEKSSVENLVPIPSEFKGISEDICDVPSCDKILSMNLKIFPTTLHNPSTRRIFYPVIHHSPQETSEEVLQAREDLMKAIQTFLRKFSRIHFGEMPKVLLVAWERFGEIKHAFTDKHYQQEDIQELMSKLLEDVRNINEELSEFINSPSWNRPTFYNDDDEYTVIYRKPKEITPDLPIEEPDNSLSMGDEHLNTIPETEKSSVENLVPIPSEFKGISEDICDVPSCDHFDAECGLINSLLSRDISITSLKIDFLPEEFVLFSCFVFCDFYCPGLPGF